jgi:hypothetical protein
VVALGGLQGTEDCGGRQVAVAAGRGQFRVGIGLGLDEGPKVRRPLRVLVFAPSGAAGREALQAADTGLLFVQALLDRVASPTETALGQAGVAVTQAQTDLGLEESALVAGQPLRPKAKQFIVLVLGVVPSRLFRDGNPREQRQPTLSRSRGRAKRKCGEISSCRSPHGNTLRLSHTGCRRQAGTGNRAASPFQMEAQPRHSPPAVLFQHALNPGQRSRLGSVLKMGLDPSFTQFGGPFR